MRPYPLKVSPILRPMRNEVTGEYIREADGRLKLLKIDVFRDLFIVLGVDPAYSDAGDDWAVTALGMDFEQYAYQLQTLHGKGFAGLLMAIIKLDTVWRPKKIGIESQPAQVVIDRLIASDPRFRRLEDRIVKIQTNGNGKDWNIEQFVAEPLKMGRLLLHPDARALKDEMTSYVPGEKAIDNMLDSIVIAMRTVKRGRSVSQEAPKDRLARRKARMNEKRSKYTGNLL